MRKLFQSRKASRSQTNTPSLTDDKTLTDVTEEILARAPRLEGHGAHHLYILGNGYLAKTAPSIYLEEAPATTFIRDNPTIPVPTIPRTFSHDNGHACIVMDLVKGELLDRAWDNLSEPQRLSIAEQFIGYMDQVRTLSTNYFSCLDRKPCHDQFFEEDREIVYGPFDPEREFVAGLEKFYLKPRFN